MVKLTTAQFFGLIIHNQLSKKHIMRAKYFYFWNHENFSHTRSEVTHTIF